MSEGDKANFDAYLAAGDYGSAAAFATQAAGVDQNGQTKNIVWSLNAGAAYLAAGNAQQGVAALDQVERLAQGNDLDRTKALLDYKYTTYDGVMTNTYKAAGFLAEGRFDDARVEFNRANDRQDRAAHEFEKEIAAATAANTQQDRPDYRNLMITAEQSPELASANRSLQALANYTPFVNPFTFYVSGLFFINQGDYSKGVDLLKRSYAMLGPDSQAHDDITWVEGEHRQHPGKPRPQVWVIFENGQSATYHQFNLVLPTIAGTPMTIALPQLTVNGPAASRVVVVAGEAHAATRPVGSFDSVMASEFQRRQPMILAAAVAEAIVKNVSAKVAQDSKNPWLQLATAVMDNVSTADTRSWTALPKEFQAARVDIPADGKLSLLGGEGQPIGEVTVPVDRGSLVWIKMQHPGARPALRVIPL